MTRRAGLGSLFSVALYYAALVIAVWLLVTTVPAVRSAFSQARLEALAGAGGFESGAAVARPEDTPNVAVLAVIAMVGALVMTVPVAWVYMITKERQRYDQSVVQTVIVLPIAVAGIVIIVQNSLALAFSLAGIVAAVRFRNTLKDTKDAVYIFLAIGVGLAAGVQALAVAFVMSVIYNLVIVGLWRFNVGAMYAAPAGAVPAAVRSAASAARPGGGEASAEARPIRGVLLVHTPVVDPVRATVEEVLERHAKRWKLAGIVAAGDGVSTLTYLLRLRRKSAPSAVLSDIRSRAGPHGATAEIESLTE